MPNTNYVRMCILSKACFIANKLGSSLSRPDNFRRFQGQSVSSNCIQSTQRMDVLQIGYQLVKSLHLLKSKFINSSRTEHLITREYTEMEKVVILMRSNNGIYQISILFCGQKRLKSTHIEVLKLWIHLSAEIVCYNIHIFHDLLNFQQFWFAKIITFSMSEDIYPS